MQRILVILIGVLLTGCEPEKAYQSQAEEIFPPVAITRAALFRLDNVGVSPAFFDDNWTLVVFGKANCSEPCQHRLALANEAGDAQALFVVEDIASHDQLRMLMDRYPSVEVSMGATAASIDAFISQFEDESIAQGHQADYIYLVSPDSELSYRLPASRMDSAAIDQELKELR